jgi:excisionase family DNA binding protein
MQRKVSTPSQSGMIQRDSAFYLLVSLCSGGWRIWFRAPLQGCNRKKRNPLRWRFAELIPPLQQFVYRRQIRRSLLKRIHSERSKGAEVKSKNSQMLTVNQLAQRLQVNSETIRRWARKQFIPAIKFSPGKKASWRFSLKDIQNWERRNTKGNGN